MSSLPPPVPGEVRGVSFTGLGGDGVRVSWQRPDYPNGVISGYRVTVEYYEHNRGHIYTTEFDNETLSLTIQHRSLGGCMFIMCYEQCNTLYYCTPSAERGVPYNGTVVAINQVGSGQGEPQLFFTRELSKWPFIMVTYKYSMSLIIL